MFEKPKGRRHCPAYLDWVATRIKEGKERCPICGEVAQEAHHEGPHSAGRKADDFWVVPLCKPCHHARHNSGLSTLVPIYQNTHNHDATIEWVLADIGYTQRRLLREFVRGETGSNQFVKDLWEEVGRYEETTSWIIGLIEWIETNHPEWITTRPKRSGGGKRRRKAKQGQATKPLTKKIGG